MDEKKQTMIKVNTLGLFIARRNYGKSYLMKYVLYIMSKGGKILPDTCTKILILFCLP
jgi:hypothetical protein